MVEERAEMYMKYQKRKESLMLRVLVKDNILE